MAVATMPKERVSPAERLARINRAKQVESGAVRIPLACPRCQSRTLDGSGDLGVRCVHCGHPASEARMHTLRRQRITRYLRTGEL